MRLILRLVMTCTVAAFAATAVAQDTGTYKKDDEGVVAPVPLKKAHPAYTQAARRERIEGTVEVQVLVRPNGTVGDVKVTRSLDQVFGLDRQAVKAARQFRFKPGTKDGKPVPVLVDMEFTFSLR